LASAKQQRSKDQFDALTLERLQFENLLAFPRAVQIALRARAHTVDDAGRVNGTHHAQPRHQLQAVDETAGCQPGLSV